MGICEAHLHVAQITLPKDTIIFFSAPFTMREGSGLRPDYWAGQASVPSGVSVSKHIVCALAACSTSICLDDALSFGYPKAG